MSLGFAGLSEVFTQMSLSPPLWSSLFYFLLFLLSSSSMVGMIEIVITTCKEITFFTRTWRNEVICGESVSCHLLDLSRVICYIYYGLLSFRPTVGSFPTTFVFSPLGVKGFCAHLYQFAEWFVNKNPLEGEGRG